MSEQQLANLLIQIGTERGLTVERVMEELAAAQLPSYIDQNRFRASLVAVAEASLRAQFEQQLARLRQQFGAPSAAPVAQAEQGRVRIDPEADDDAMPIRRNADAAMGPRPSPAAQGPTAMRPDARDLPRDATIVWMKRDGEEPD